MNLLGFHWVEDKIRGNHYQQMMWVTLHTLSQDVPLVTLAPRIGSISTETSIQVGKKMYFSLWNIKYIF